MKNETKSFAAWLWNQFSTPWRLARPTGSTRRKTRRVSNKKFNGLLKVAARADPRIRIKRYTRRKGGIFRDRLSKAATFLPFFTHTHTHAFKSVSVRKIPSLHATLFEYSGEILATYSLTGARASPFRLFHRTLPSWPWLPPKCNPLPDICIYLVQSCARGQGRSLIVLLWSQSTPRRDPVNRNSIPLEPIGRLKLISSGYRDTREMRHAW